MSINERTRTMKDWVQSTSDAGIDESGDDDLGNVLAEHTEICILDIALSELDAVNTDAALREEVIELLSHSGDFSLRRGNVGAPVVCEWEWAL